MIRRLTTERNKAAKALDFDQAALLRDQIFELKATLAK
ncbi:MAG: UvrB/UvrC motif-containing protein [Mollicutes bacterium]|nr:UvrB/UvrC motif-containing protein [Mollicutes bacterium]MDY5852596.1 UvrB/UvrC motif-containing protein [Candidatus Enterosoma sp.]